MSHLNYHNTLCADEIAWNMSNLHEQERKLLGTALQFSAVTKSPLIIFLVFICEIEKEFTRKKVFLLFIFQTRLEVPISLCLDLF